MEHIASAFIPSAEFVPQYVYIYPRGVNNFWFDTFDIRFFSILGLNLVELLSLHLSLLSLITMPPPAKPPQPLKLTFTTTSLRNVTIATDNDEYYYEVVSRFWESNVTKINRLDPESGKMIPMAELLKDEDRRDAPYTGLKFIDPDKPDTAPITPDSFLGLGDSASKNAYA